MLLFIFYYKYCYYVNVVYFYRDLLILDEYDDFYIILLVLRDVVISWFSSTIVLVASTWVDGII